LFILTRISTVEGKVRREGLNHGGLKGRIIGSYLFEECCTVDDNCFCQCRDIVGKPKGIPGAKSMLLKYLEMSLSTIGLDGMAANAERLSVWLWLPNRRFVAPGLGTSVAGGMRPSGVSSSSK
jgi:hypothetical protein